MSYGWLCPRPDIKRDASWFGVDMDPTLRTRWEEFTFARDELRDWSACDPPSVGGWRRIDNTLEANGHTRESSRGLADDELLAMENFGPKALAVLRERYRVDELRLLDMGCGFEPRVHVMPEIAAGLGWSVEAIDILDAPGPTHLWAHNPPHPLIRRRIMDMRATDYPDEHFDAVLSISVLEHVSPQDRAATYAEARRVLKPGGLLVVTMDGNWPTHVDGFRFGDPVIPQVPLTNDIHQPVCFLVGVKNG